MRDTLTQLHWLAQYGAAFGQHLPKHPQWHHLALRVEGAAWRTAPANGTQLVIWPAEGSVGVHWSGGTKRFPVEGKTLKEVGKWLEGQLAERNLEGALKLRDPKDMPGHPVVQGARFEPDPQDLRAIAAMYAQGERVIEVWRDGREGAAPVLLWPHHFDVSCLWPLADGEDPPAVTAGLAPGDATHKTPYWYLTMWPYPEAPKLPEIEGARWNTDGWTGAILPWRKNQADEEVAAFLEAATDVARSVLV